MSHFFVPTLREGDLDLPLFVRLCVRPKILGRRWKIGGIYVLWTHFANVKSLQGLLITYDRDGIYRYMICSSRTKGR